MIDFQMQYCFSQINSIKVKICDAVLAYIGMDERY